MFWEPHFQAEILSFFHLCHPPACQGELALTFRCLTFARLSSISGNQICIHLNCFTSFFCDQWHFLLFS